MRITILLQITGDDGVSRTAEEIASFDKSSERTEDLGMSLREGKALLATLQNRTVKAQAEAWFQRHRRCPACSTKRCIKGYYPAVFHTLYGDIVLDSPRLYRCACQADQGATTVSPLQELVAQGIAPERLYLESRWASLVSYGAAAGLLADVLPITAGLNATTVRQHTLKVAERAEAELAEEQPCFIDGDENEWAALPNPQGRIVVGLDGGYVRNWDERKSNFELIVGRSVPEDQGPRYLGLTHGYDRKPKRRLFEVLKSQGLQANQEVTFLTDGGDEVRALTELVTPAAEHVLDWFHITMRLTVLGQYVRGVAQADESAGNGLSAMLERIKWWLWHGNSHQAEQAIEAFEADIDALEVDYANLGKLVRAAHEFAGYIRHNTASLINYGERYRSGEPISSSIAESTVNVVISKRFAKRQQMQWTKRGAHLLLQTRTRALDGTLLPLFERWYPGLANDNSIEAQRAAA